MKGPRTIVWLALAATTLAAVVIAFLMAPRWAREGASAPLEVLGEIGSMELVGVDGAPVELENLAGRPWVADLVFTRCALTCPRMTEHLVRLGRLVPESAAWRRVSISVDPEHDRPEVLAAYAARHGAVDPDWLFLTGSREEIRRVAFEELKIGYDDRPPPEMVSALEPIVHSTRFVLVDGRARVRGYYDPFDGAALGRLAADVVRLAAEVTE